MVLSSYSQKQIRDSEKGGVIGEDDEFIATVSKSDSWWDDDEAEDKNAKYNKVVIDAKTIVTREVPDEEDNASLPTLNTKVEGDEEYNIATMQSMLSGPIYPLFAILYCALYY